MIDAFNALRHAVYGELAALPHDRRTAMLPVTFADRLFQKTKKLWRKRSRPCASPCA